MVLVLACTGSGALGAGTALAQVPVPQPFPPPVADEASELVAPVTETAVAATKTATDTASTAAGRIERTASAPPSPPPARHPAGNEIPAAGRERTDTAPPATGGPARESGRAAPRTSRSRASGRPRTPAPAVVTHRPQVRRPSAPVAQTGSPDAESPRALPPFIGDVADGVGSVAGRLPDWSRPIIAVLLALVLLLASRAYLSGRRVKRLEGARRALRADVDVLQAALVPVLSERIGGVELSVAYRPADGLASGGDFYDVFALDERRTGFILGDVSGHDRRAIARATAVRHKLRAYLEFGLEPRMVLHAAGEAMADDDGDGAFATAAVAVHDAGQGTLTYACAGHEPPILTGGAAHEPVSACSSAPLGWGLPTGRRQTTVVLGAGDCACFFTDGFTDARCDGAFLGRDGLERLVAGLGVTGTAGDLIDDATELAGMFEDDLAALVIRAAAGVAAPCVRVEEVELDADDMRRHAPERFLSSCHAPMPLIEDLTQRAQAAIDAGHGAVLRLRYDAETTGLGPHRCDVFATAAGGGVFGRATALTP